MALYDLPRQGVGVRGEQYKHVRPTPRLTDIQANRKRTCGDTVSDRFRLATAQADDPRADAPGPARYLLLATANLNRQIANKRARRIFEALGFHDDCVIGGVILFRRRKTHWREPKRGYCRPPSDHDAPPPLEWAVWVRTQQVFGR